MTLGAYIIKAVLVLLLVIFFFLIVKRYRAFVYTAI